MTTCRQWTTRCCGAAGRPAIAPSTRPPRSWPATRCSRWRSRCWHGRTTRPTPISACALVLGLARAAGALGMCGGQLLDLMAERRPLGPAEVALMQRLKTGALIRFAAEAGSILGRAAPAQAAALECYADDLGLAFQIRTISSTGGRQLRSPARTAAATGPSARRRSSSCWARPGRAPSCRSCAGRPMARLDIFAGRPTVLPQLFDFVIQPAILTAHGQKASLAHARQPRSSTESTSRRSARARPSGSPCSWRPSCGRRRSTRCRSPAAIWAPAWAWSS